MRKPSLALRGIFRIAGLLASEEELGDAMEEYAARRESAFWVCRQLITATGRRRSRRAATEGSPAMLSQIGTDVSYAIRTLRRYPGFALAAIAPIALGLGINTGIFSVFDAMALEPVASPHPSELVSIYQNFQGVKKRRVHGARAMFSTPEFERYRSATRTMSGVMAYSRASTVTLGGDAPRPIDAALVTCNYFEVLQIRPAIGAGFTDANCGGANAAPAVVLTHELWTELFGADRDLAGKTIVVNARVFAIAGVAPSGFRGIDFERVSLFAPVSAQPLLQPGNDFFRDPITSWLTMIARRRPGVTIEEARSELAVVAAQIDLEQPGRTTTLMVAPARALSIPQARRDVFDVAMVVLAAFGLVLLIACANVANLLLARGAARGKEIAVRLSLGISRRRLVQQLLTESLVIAFAGAAAGVILAHWCFRMLLASLTSAFPGRLPAIAMEAGLNANVMLFALVLTVATGLGFGIVPALQASRFDLQTLLNRDSAGAGRRGGWLRGSLVGVQAAVCVMLLIPAALLLRTVYVTETLEPGFDYRHVAVVAFDLRGPGYDAPRGAAFRQRLIDRLRSLPGVDAVAEASKTPLSPGRSETAVRRADQAEWREVDFSRVSPDYFSAAAIPIVRGRTFKAEELNDPSGAVIVTESTARRFFPGDDPIGRTLQMALGPDASVSLDVVGVARDAQVSRVGESDTSYLYLPASRSIRDVSLLVRSSTPLATLAPEVRSAARALEPALAVNVTPLDDNLGFWRAVARLTSGLSGALSGLSLLLAAIGIYGVVSYVVSRRVREIGIRMMLGASVTDVRRLIVGQTLWPVVLGLIVGIAGAAAVARLLESVLFGVNPFDPVAFVGAPLLLAGIAAAASVAPIRQAVKRDPMAALRRY